jgi:CrcB protein
LIRNFLLVGFGGGLGSMLRYGTGLLVGPKQFPLATLLINTAGSLFIGLAMAYSLKNESFQNNWKIFLATGICGGFTTFSAFSLENLLLLENGKHFMLVLNIACSIAAGMFAVWSGFKIINFVAH